MDDKSQVQVQPAKRVKLFRLSPSIIDYIDNPGNITLSIEGIINKQTGENKVVLKIRVGVIELIGSPEISIKEIIKSMEEMNKWDCCKDASAGKGSKANIKIIMNELLPMIFNPGETSAWDSWERKLNDNFKEYCKQNNIKQTPIVFERYKVTVDKLLQIIFFNECGANGIKVSSGVPKKTGGSSLSGGAYINVPVVSQMYSAGAYLDEGPGKGESYFPKIGSTVVFDKTFFEILGFPKFPINWEATTNGEETVPFTAMIKYSQMLFKNIDELEELEELEKGVTLSNHLSKITSDLWGKLEEIKKEKLQGPLENLLETSFNLTKIGNPSKNAVITLNIVNWFKILMIVNKELGDTVQTCIYLAFVMLIKSLLKLNGVPDDTSEFITKFMKNYLNIDKSEIISYIIEKFNSSDKSLKSLVDIILYATIMLTCDKTVHYRNIKLSIASCLTGSVNHVLTGRIYQPDTDPLKVLLTLLEIEFNTVNNKVIELKNRLIKSRLNGNLFFYDIKRGKVRKTPLTDFTKSRQIISFLEKVQSEALETYNRLYNYLLSIKGNTDELKDIETQRGKILDDFKKYLLPNFIIPLPSEKKIGELGKTYTVKSKGCYMIIPEETETLNQLVKEFVAATPFVSDPISTTGIPQFGGYGPEFMYTNEDLKDKIGNFTANELYLFYRILKKYTDEIMKKYDEIKYDEEEEEEVDLIDSVYISYCLCIDQLEKNKDPVFNLEGMNDYGFTNSYTYAKLNTAFETIYGNGGLYTPPTEEIDFSSLPLGGEAPYAWRHLFTEEITPPTLPTIPVESEDKEVIQEAKRRRPHVQEDEEEEDEDEEEEEEEDEEEEDEEEEEDGGEFYFKKIINEFKKISGNRNIIDELKLRLLNTSVYDKEADRVVRRMGTTPVKDRENKFAKSSNTPISKQYKYSKGKKPSKKGNSLLRNITNTVQKAKAMKTLETQFLKMGAAQTGGKISKKTLKNNKKINNKTKKKIKKSYKYSKTCKLNKTHRKNLNKKSNKIKTKRINKRINKRNKIKK